MNKIKLSKSVTVNKDKSYCGIDFYERICRESYRLLNDYINPRSNQENVLETIQKNTVENAASNLGHYVKSYFNSMGIDKHVINCRANMKIEVTFSKIEIVKADSNFENCDFVLHFISKELYFKAFAGNSVIVSPLTDGLHTIMVDFDNKEVAVEYFIVS